MGDWFHDLLVCFLAITIGVLVEALIHTGGIGVAVALTVLAMRHRYANR